MKARIVLLGLALAASTMLALFAAENEDTFGGIGVVVAQLYDQDSPDHRGELVVLGIPPETPGARAGLRPGDVIVSVDGHATKGTAFDKAVRDQLRGPVGSIAVLAVRRVGRTELIDFKIPRVDLKG